MDTILGLPPITVITILTSLAVFMAVLAVWSTAIERNSIAGRVKELQARRESLRAGYMATKKRTSPIRNISGVGVMRKVVERLKLLQTEKQKQITNRLAQAGYRSKDAVVIYSFIKLLSPIGGLVMAVIMVYGLKLQADNPSMQGLLALGCVIGGFYTPEIFIKNAIDKRTDAIRKAFPDALDLLVICAEAGLSMDASMKRVAKEIGNSSSELSDELSLTSLELGFLPERRQALTNLADRVDLKAVKSVVATLIQTEKYGTPLSHSLRVLSAEFRNDRLMLAEEKAARLPAVMTIPLIMFILPVLFIVLLGPATCSVSDNLVNRSF